MAEYKIYQVDAFTSEPFTGNPAGVVPDARGLGEAQMLAIARELNNSETAFVFPARDDTHDVWVRFFTPTSEVPICGHATIATHFVRAIFGHAEGTTRQLTGAGVLGVDIEPNDRGSVRIWMRQRPATFSRGLNDNERRELFGALGLGPADVNEASPIQIVSTGHSKVMIPLVSRTILEGLTPDLKALCNLSERIGCSGYYPFTLDRPDEDTLSTGRMFAPKIGVAEDPVTGNAIGCLGAYLIEHRLMPEGSDGTLRFTAGQGRSVGRPGRVAVEATRGRTNDQIEIRIGGEATIVFETVLSI